MDYGPLLSGEQIDSSFWGVLTEQIEPCKDKGICHLFPKRKWACLGSLPPGER